MTKSNLFSALNAAIEQRAELLTVRGEIVEAMQCVGKDCSQARLELRENLEFQLTKIDAIEEAANKRFGTAIAKLDAVIGEDPAEQKQAA